MYFQISHSANKGFLITDVRALEVLDSRGNPTIEVRVELSNGAYGVGISPSGASTGKFEAFELRDEEVRYRGLGVQKAVKHVNTIISQNICGLDAREVQSIDRILIELDGTKNKSNLGSNAILATSLAVAKSAANGLNIPLHSLLGSVNSNTLPVPMINIINGGAHASNNLDIQEFMIMPVSPTRFSEALRMGSDVFNSLKKTLEKDGKSTSVGDEGGFAPELESTNEALEYLMKAITKIGLEPGKDIVIALDCASSTFYKDKIYTLDKKQMDSSALSDYYFELINKFPIFSIEDPFDEEDYSGFANFTSKYSNKVQIVGDDLFCTNSILLTKGIKEKWANAVLIKPNQVGTITETFNAIQLAQRNGLNTIISHRSGETEDTTIAHIAIASSARQIKTGSLSRTDRIAKYNELLRIEHALGDNATYPSSDILNLLFK